MRRDERASVLTMVIVLVVAVLLVAVAWYVLATRDTFAATVRMELSSRSTGEIYDAEMELDADAGFFEEFFSLSVGGETFPAGDHVLELRIYEGTVSTDQDVLLTTERWDVGNLYKVNDQVESVWEVTVRLPKDYAEEEEGAVYLYGFVYYDSNQIGREQWVLNPETLTVT